MPDKILVQKATDAAHLYGLVLWLYPADHREAFGPLMVDAFRDAYVDTYQAEGSVPLRFWLSVIEDELKSVVRERVTAWKGAAAMKSYRYGVALSAFLVILIVWHTVIAPTFESDDEYGLVPYLLGYGVIFLYFALSGYLASRRTNCLADGTWVGLITAVIGITVVTLTYFVVDNVFFGIVSKQPDKINGFAHSDYTTMRDYINSSLVLGMFTIIPIFAMIGAVCGTAGAWVRQVLTRSMPPAASN